MTSVAPETPARGTRPRNRREITLQVATELFYRRGYPRVGMSDIAEATNVGASAIYRHFSSKAELLDSALRAGLARYTEVIAEGSAVEGDAGERLSSVLRLLADSAVELRRHGVLWQRDARNLPADDQRALREILSTTAADLSGIVRAARPELDDAQADALAWFTLGALVSIGFHSQQLPQPDFDDLLFDIVTRVVATPLPQKSTHAAQVEDAPAPESRRDNLITVATALFAVRGFAATGIDEIGDAAGIAGPSVYSHFASKQAILAAAIERAAALLRGRTDVILETEEPAEAKLGHLVDSFVSTANRDRFVIGTLISEMDQLDAEDRERAREEQRRFIDDWVGLLQQITGVDPVSARIRVQAVLLAVNDAMQTPHLRSQPGFEQTLSLIAKTALEIPITESRQLLLP